MVGERGVLRRWRREKKKRARGGSRNLRRDLFFPSFFRFLSFCFFLLFHDAKQLKPVCFTFFCLTNNS